MEQKPPAKTGLSRIWAAFFYSLDGLRFAISNEAAFRQELCIFALAFFVLLFLPLSLQAKGLILFATAVVLVVELLNSAIESVVDMASPEYHILAKRAKDLSSAAVLVSIIVAVFMWGGAIFLIILDGH